MNVIIKDFFQLGSFRVLARFIRGLRGLFIITHLSPSLLGEYTIWLLYIFYFSFLELGVSNGLERDLPHYRGKKDESALQITANIGWSSFFYLSLMSSLCLAIFSFIVFRQWILALSLAGCLLTDKLFRAYNTNARIFFKFKASGIAELIQATISLSLIYYLLPHYGPYSIFPCFIVGSIVASIYLNLCSRIHFRWSFQIAKFVEYIKVSFPLALMSNAIQIFNMIPMTVVAFIWDKEMLGYFAFAFRIFQICLAIFPFLIREVMGARMYFHMAKTEDHRANFQDLIFPMFVYSVITSVFWLVTYWWSILVIERIAPEYGYSAVALNILIFSLMPLGISIISSDFLCSRIYNKVIFVTYCWIIGIVLQIAGILLVNQNYSNVFNVVPTVHILNSALIYFIMVGYAFRIGKTKAEGFFSMAYLVSPLVVASLLVFLIQNIFNGIPSLDISRNILFSIASIIGTLVFSFWLIYYQMLRKFNKGNI